mgnify:CR=1 FL=1
MRQEPLDHQPPLLLVGIDYPVWAPNARSRDYTMEDSVATRPTRREPGPVRRVVRCRQPNAHPREP